LECQNGAAMTSRNDQVVLKLEGVCIHTSAKRAYDRLLAEFLDPETPQYEILAKQDQFEILKKFLEESDFSRIRAETPDFDGNKRISVGISFSAGKWVLRKIPGDFAQEEEL